MSTGHEDRDERPACNMALNTLAFKYLLAGTFVSVSVIVVVILRYTTRRFGTNQQSFAFSSKSRLASRCPYKPDLGYCYRQQLPCLLLLFRLGKLILEPSSRISFLTRSPSSPTRASTGSCSTGAHVDRSALPGPQLLFTSILLPSSSKHYCKDRSSSHASQPLEAKHCSNTSTSPSKP